MNIPEIKIKISFDKKLKKSELISITKSSDIFKLAKEVFNKDTFDWTEEFIIFCLNRRNKVLGFYKVSSGSTSGTLVDLKVIFTIALNSLAHNIITIHNHPSGNIKPSEIDINLFKRLITSGKLLGIEVIDNIIISNDEYWSFSDEKSNN